MSRAVSHLRSAESSGRKARPPQVKGRWRGAKRLLLIVAALALVSLVGHWWGRKHITAGFRNAHLEVDPQQLDLGEVWEQNGFCWTLPIRNLSRRDVAVSRFIGSCRCVDVTPRSLVIPAGKTAEVRLALDLTTGDPRQTAPHSRPFSIQIVPVIENGLPQYQGWELEGLVRRAFRLSSPSVTFGDSLVSGEPFPARTVEVTANVRLGRLTAEPELEAPAAVTLERAEEAGRYLLRVAPEETAVVGRHDFNVLLKGVTETGERLPPFPIPVMMEVVDDIQTVPASVPFGSLPLGESAEETVVLRSRTGKSFEVVKADADPKKGVWVERSTTTGRDACFRVRQRAVALRSQGHYIRFTLQVDSGEATQELAVAVSYYGVEGTATTE